MEEIPPEVLCEIFKYLSFKDRRQMALVNTHWHYASINPEFARNEVFVYSKEDDNKTDMNSSLPLLKEFRSMLLNSNRKFFNLKLHGSLNNNNVFPIFKNLANNIVSLHIDNLQTLTNSLLNTILRCNKLEQLEFKNVKYFSITNIHRKPILSLKRIFFYSAKLSDYTFNIIMKCAPNLEDLGFNRCRILRSAKYINRLYPNYRNSQKKPTFNSRLFLSVVNIINYLETAKNINKLNLGRCYKIIFYLPIHIKLVSLELKMTKRRLQGQKYNELCDILSNQTTLENLDLQFIPCSLLESCIPKLNNLRRLKLVYINSQSYDYSSEALLKIIDSLKNKNKLRNLSIFPSKYSNTSDYLTPIEIPNCILESLISYTGLYSGLKLANLGLNLINLKIINGHILTSYDFKLLFQNLTKLRNINIEKCFELDDNVFYDLPISKLKELRFLRLTSTKLTYQCLKYINNSELRQVIISYISLEPCIVANSWSDFENVFKIFSSCVPELIHFSIHFQETRKFKNYNLLVEARQLIVSLLLNFKKFSLTIQ